MPESKARPPWTTKRESLRLGLFADIAELGLSDIDALDMQLAKLGVKMREGVCHNVLAARDRLKTLWESRQRGGVNINLWIVARGVASMGREGESEKESLVWLWLCNHGIGDLCADMITDEGFFDEHPIYLVEILNLYAYYLGGILDEDRQDDWGLDPTVPETLAIARRVCDCLWVHRYIFVDKDLDQYCSGAVVRLRQSLRKILCALIQAPEDEPEVKLTETLARPLAFFCWYHSAEVEKSGSIGAQSATTLLMEGPLQLLTLAPGDGSAETEEEAARRFADLDAFVDHDIIAVYGTENYVRRLKITLQQPWVIDTELALFFLTAGKTLGHPNIVPQLASVDMYTTIKEALDRQLLHGADEGQWTILRQVLRIYRGMTNHAAYSEGPGPLIRQGRVIELIGRTCRIYSQVASASAGQDRDDVLLGIMSSYTEISRAVNRMSAKNPVRKVLRSSLRDEWYPTLAMLQVESSRPRVRKAASKEQLVALIAGWRTLGEAIDLEETQEKAEHERRIKRQSQHARVVMKRDTVRVLASEGIGKTVVINCAVGV
ncbi:unnamed protein product [Peniophora sp. CBMAI 1063]|nr:unnamed protein product [Peniophora sp. CBMAI 1063]